MAKFATAEIVECCGGLWWYRKSAVSVPAESLGLAGDGGTDQHTEGLGFPLGLYDREMEVLGV